MKYGDKDFSHSKIQLKLRTRINLVWGKSVPTSNKEALAFPEGFPAALYMTNRRVFITGTFMEKRGLLRKKKLNTVYFEAGLQYIDKINLEIFKKVKSGYISFKPHGDIKNGIIHFLRLTPDMIRSMKSVLDAAQNIKKLREDTGIVILGENPLDILKMRLSK